MDSEEGYETIPADKPASRPKQSPPNDLYKRNSTKHHNGSVHTMVENPRSNVENVRSTVENPRNGGGYQRSAVVDSEYEVVENKFATDQAINKDLNSGQFL